MSDAPVQDSRGRRAPVQGRSQETVQRVLAAASALLARGVPVDALTTASIATEAGLSVGALYRFFPDKQAIVDAIALRHMELFQAALGSALMLAFPPDPGAFLGQVLDAFVAYLDANPDFRTVAYGAPGGGRAISRTTHDAEAGSGQVAEMVREFLVEAFDLTPDADFGWRLRIATEVGDRLLAFAFEQPDLVARARVLAEAKRMIASYVFG